MESFKPTGGAGKSPVTHANGVSDTLGSLCSDRIEIHAHRCVAVRNRHASCRACADACTTGAISREPSGAVVIDQTLCVGCGTCATACPTCAIEARHPNDSELILRCHDAIRASQGTLTLACVPAIQRAFECNSARRTDVEKTEGPSSCQQENATVLPAPDRVVTLTCLGRANETLLTDAVAFGARSVTLVHADCSACPHTAGGRVAQSVCDSENSLLAEWGSPVRAELSEEFPTCSLESGHTRDAERTTPSSPEGRRGESLASGADSCPEPADFAWEGAPALESNGAERNPRKMDSQPLRRMKVGVDGTLPHFIPDRRERLLDALADLGNAMPADDSAVVDTRLWGHVTFDESACISCRMCTTFCPTGALRRFDTPDGIFGVEHTPADCVACKCCEDICTHRAITVEAGATLASLIDGRAERHVMKEPPRHLGTPMAVIESLRSTITDMPIYRR